MSDDARQPLLDLPETGMGFQLVEATDAGVRKPFLILNAEMAIDLSSIGLERTDDPSAILRNGLRIVQEINEDVRVTFITSWELHSFSLIGCRVPSGLTTNAAQLSPQATQPSSLTKSLTLQVNRRFFRFSAFSPDRRVNPTTGDFLPGTYAAPESEVSFAPTGFSAVGRFALPNHQPASHRYEIEAPIGTAVQFGTVAPAFGQAGGGVEAYFQKAVRNSQTPPVPPVLLPDE